MESHAYRQVAPPADIRELFATEPGRNKVTYLDEK
jgi:hypothetical protein